MGYQEKSDEYTLIDRNNFNNSPLFNSDASYESIFQNVSEVQKYENYDYYVHGYYNSNGSNKINESTGFSSNYDSNLTLKSFKDFENILNPEKEKLFNIKKKRHKRKRGIRTDGGRTNFVRLSLNCNFNKKVLNYVKEEYPDSKLKKFPEKFIAQVALVRNKYYLDMKLISLYEESKSKKYKETNNKKKPKTHSKNKKFITLDEIKEEPGVKELLEKTFKELVNEYLDSIEFKNYCETLNETGKIEKAKMLRHCGKIFAGKTSLFDTLK